MFPRNPTQTMNDPTFRDVRREQEKRVHTFFELPIATPIAITTDVVIWWMHDMSVFAVRGTATVSNRADRSQWVHKFAGYVSDVNSAIVYTNEDGEPGVVEYRHPPWARITFDDSVIDFVNEIARAVFKREHTHMPTS